MVSGADGIWAACAWEPLDFGGPTRSGDEYEGQQCSEISRVVAPVCAVDEEGIGWRISGERERLAVHDTDSASAAGETRGDSVGDARGRKRAAADSGESDQSAVLAADRRVWKAHRRAGDYEYVFQSSR